MLSLWLCNCVRLRVYLCTESFTERCFQPTQMYFCAVLQNASLASPDTDDAVRRSNADWLTSGLEQGKGATVEFTRNRKIEKPIKDQKIQYEKHRLWLQWILLIVFNTHCTP